MDFILNHLLTLILFFPVLAALILFILPSELKNLQRWTALVLSIIPLILSLVLWFNFKAGEPGFQFQEIYTWYSPINASYHVGVDGISLILVLLTTLLTPLAILTSFTITDRVKAYMILFFLLELGMLGVFVTLDLLLFFVFWEFALKNLVYLIFGKLILYRKKLKGWV